MGFQSFFEPVLPRRSGTHRVGQALRSAALAALLLAAGGCVTVQPQDKEFLADPAMTFGSDAITEGHETHVFSNREGSFGGGAVSGGGCGCN